MSQGAPPPYGYGQPAQPPNQYPPNQYPPNQYPPNQYPPNQYPPNQYPGAQMQAPPPQGDMSRTTVVVNQRAGGCHACGGATYETFSTAGIIWAICCFPLGLICLFNDKDIKCASCGKTQ